MVALLSTRPSAVNLTVISRQMFWGGGSSSELTDLDKVYHGAFAGSSKAVASLNMLSVSAPGATAQVPSGWLKL